MPAQPLTVSVAGPVIPMSPPQPALVPPLAPQSAPAAPQGMPASLPGASMTPWVSAPAHGALVPCASTCSTRLSGACASIRLFSGAGTDSAAANGEYLGGSAGHFAAAGGAAGGVAAGSHCQTPTRTTRAGYANRRGSPGPSAGTDSGAATSNNVSRCTAASSCIATSRAMVYSLRCYTVRWPGARTLPARRCKQCY